jgi:hypothetical protein
LLCKTRKGANPLITCNLGSGIWKGAPSAVTIYRRLELGSFATTKAKHTPGLPEQKFVRDLPYARAYGFQDGKLYLPLMADGEIYAWRQ